MTLLTRLKASTATDALARRAIENGRDWRGRARLTSGGRRWGRTRAGEIAQATAACRVIDGCGYNFCDVCGGNDFLDVPFTCGVAS